MLLVYARHQFMLIQAESCINYCQVIKVLLMLSLIKWGRREYLHYNPHIENVTIQVKLNV